MVTIRDVAREAGVSIATVSRVFNNSAAVAEETRNAVRAIAQRLRYVPHGAARSLITRRTATIGLILPDLYGEFFSELIRGVDAAARAHGYHLLVSSSHADRAEVDAALRLMRGRVDGIVVMLPQPDAHLPLPDAARLPVVRIGGSDGDMGADAIVVANRAGARAMVRHLVELGHRRIAVITGASDNADADERLRGYREALREAGLAPSAALEAAGDFSEASGFRAAMTLLASHPAPTAVFALNDAMAIGALSALRSGGLTVPGDVAVVGFDDIPMASYVDPPLTSVHVDISALGERAAGRLLARLGTAAPASGVEVFPTTLVVRRSCGSTAAWHPPVPEEPS